MPNYAWSDANYPPGFPSNLLLPADSEPSPLDTLNLSDASFVVASKEYTVKRSWSTLSCIVVSEFGWTQADLASDFQVHTASISHALSIWNRDISDYRIS